MDRRRLLLDIWNWLPAFQAVAETEHLPTAAVRLHVTPSALSRAVTSVEDRLGRQLFARKGRSLALNANGRRLLTATTHGFAALNAGLAALASGEVGGPIYACASGPLAQAIVVPALRELQLRSSALVPHVYVYDDADALDLLRSGQLDVVFSSTRIEAPELATTFLGEASNGVYCGAKHPLFGSGDTQTTQVLAHAFVASCSPTDGKPQDSFPPDLERRVDLHVHQGHVMLDLCLGGHLLAVLTDFVAEPHVRAGALRRLPFPSLPSSPLFAVADRAEGRHERVRLAIDRVGQTLAGAVTGAQGRGRDDPAVPGVARGRRRHDAEWLVIGDGLLVSGEYKAAQRAYDSAHRALRKAHRAGAEDDVLYAMACANVLTRQGRYRDAELACKRAMGGANAAIAARLEAIISLTRCYRGDFEGARAALELARGYAVAAATRSLEESGRANALVQRAEGNLLLETDRAHEAIAAFERCVATCEAHGDDWERSIALFNLGEAHAVAGDLPNATRMLDESYRQKRAIGDRWGQGHVHLVRARLALGREDLAGAVRDVTAGLEVATGVADPRLLAALNNVLGQVRHEVGELDEARRAFRFALRDAERCDARVESIRALLGLGRVDFQRGGVAAAKAHAERALALAKKGDAQPELARTLYALGQVASAQDKASDAARFFRAAFDAETARARPASTGRAGSSNPSRM